MAKYLLKNRIFIFTVLAVFLCVIGVIVYSYLIPGKYFYSHIDKSVNGVRRFTYNGCEWNGMCEYSSIDNTIAFNDVECRDFRRDLFSISWVGAFYVPKSERYKFKISSDDGSYLYIDGKLIIDNGGVHPDKESKQKTVFLFKGFHIFVLDYYELCSKASILFSYKKTKEGNDFSSLLVNFYPIKEDFRLEEYKAKVKESASFRSCLIGFCIVLVILVWLMKAFLKYIVLLIMKVFAKLKDVLMEILTHSLLLPGKLFLILILAYAGFLRFYSLKDRGLIWGDEFEYYQYARNIFDNLDKIVADGGGIIARLSSLLSTASYYFAKPGHELLIILGSLIGGLKLYTPLYISAFLSLMTVYLIYSLARRLFGLNAAYLSAIIFSVSAYDIIYARSALSQAPATFFLTLGVYLYILSKKQNSHIYTKLFLAGLCVGYAFTCHYCAGIFPWILCISEAQYFLISSQKKIKTAMKRVMILIFSMAVPLIFFDVLSRFGHKIIPYWMGGGGGSYLNNVFRQSFAREQGGHGGLPFYAYVLWRQEGPIVLTFLLIGIFVFIFDFIWKKKNEAFSLLLWSLVPLFFWSFNGRFGTQARILAPAIPAMALISGCAVVRIPELFKFSLKMRRVFIAIAAIGVLIYGSWNSKSVINARSMFTQLVMYLNGKNINRVIITADIGSPGLMGSDKIMDDKTGYPPASKIKFYRGFTEENILSIAKQ